MNASRRVQIKNQSCERHPFLRQPIAVWRRFGNWQDVSSTIDKYLQPVVNHRTTKSQPDGNRLSISGLYTASSEWAIGARTAEPFTSRVVQPYGVKNSLFDQSSILLLVTRVISSSNVIAHLPLTSETQGSNTFSSTPASHKFFPQERLLFASRPRVSHDLIMLPQRLDRLEDNFISRDKHSFKINKEIRNQRVH